MTVEEFTGVGPRPAPRGQWWRRLKMLARYLVFPAMGALPAVGLAAIVLVIEVLAIAGLWNTVLLAIYFVIVVVCAVAAALMGVVAFVLLFLRTTRPFAVGYLVASVIGVSVVVFIPVLAHALETVIG